MREFGAKSSTVTGFPLSSCVSFVGIIAKIVLTNLHLNIVVLIRTSGRKQGTIHHYKHQGLDPSIRSITSVTTALANVSSVFQFSLSLWFVVI
jgi:hypothetical protein